MKEKKIVPINAETLQQAIRNKFPPPEFAVIPYVSNATGMKMSRQADAIMMSLYPSRGIYLHGFEIKVFRNDWLNELKNPDKAEAIAQYCDFWWIVAPKDMVKIEELPKNWGLLEFHNGSLRVKDAAVKLNPKPIDKSFVGAILRKAQKVSFSEGRIDAAYESGHKSGFEYGEKIAESKYYENMFRHNQLLESVTKFKESSGVDINVWNAGDIGEAVKLVLNKEDERIRGRLNQLYAESENIYNSLKESLKK